MRDSEVESSILGALYVSYFRSESAVNLHELCEELGTENTTFWNLVNLMVQEGLISPRSTAGHGRICPAGIVHAELSKVAPLELVAENERVRTLALNLLSKIHEESGSHAETHVQTLSANTGVDPAVMGNNLWVLRDLGVVESTMRGCYKITYSGIEVVRKLRQQTAIDEEFECIRSMNPQVRGRALQKLLARALENSGWTQEEGVRTSHEEMDVIVHRHREYFLVESKWEKDPIKAAVVRELYGKLSNRVGILGILFSMSGFTRGARKQGEDYASSRIILFFGPRDTESVIHDTSSFDSLLSAKRLEMVARKKVVFE